MDPSRLSKRISEKNTKSNKNDRTPEQLNRTRYQEYEETSNLLLKYETEEDMHGEKK